MSIEATIPNRPQDDFALIESLGWRRGKYTFLAEHLARLSASAAHFGFGSSKIHILEALRNYESGLDALETYKVRVQLERSGDFRLEHEPLLQDRSIGTIVISPGRTCSSDPLLRHKTTRRELYDWLFLKARRLGHREVLFLNERGELTECANHNVFVLTRDGCLLTPEVSCGLLPGIYRNYVLETVLHTASAVLHLEDLGAAEEIYICNSVRGMQQVQWFRETVLDF